MGFFTTPRPRQEPVRRNPAALPSVRIGPVSGLASLDSPPSQAKTPSGIKGEPSLAYRCGGSSGIASRGRAPLSRLTTGLEASGTRMRRLCLNLLLWKAVQQIKTARSLHEPIEGVKSKDPD